ncbi:unnamed protein product [Arctia plantaginis]|uniref:trypsin n=1 Tax=Arctia plantaginis TaxID=874455 RepID=A0A8S0ZJ30_ARCPL|nr:unnamed protein product [Arctia plantaginis]
MLCVTLILIAIVSCGASEIRNAVGAEDFHIKVVSIESLKPNDDSRIVGGSPTSIQNFPYTVQILNNERFSCGGSILTTRHVLSAAHCYFRNGTFLGPEPFSIRAGATYLNEAGSVHSVSTIVIHHGYNRTITDNDVAVLVLATVLRFTVTIQRATIPFQGETLTDNSTVVAVGWGRTISGGEVSNVLNAVSVRTVNRGVCRQRYIEYASRLNSSATVTDNMICAGLLDIGGADTCQGDSGGPLIYNGTVVGITSWGAGCAQPLYPGVYAKVSRYTTWINDTVTTYNGSPRSQAGIIAVLMPFIFVLFRV